LIRVKAGDPKGGLADINAAIALAPDYYPAHVNKGTLLAEYFNNPFEGCAEYRQGLALCLAGHEPYRCGDIENILKTSPSCMR
jgi:hypothetical protein